MKVFCIISVLAICLLICGCRAANPSNSTTPNKTSKIEISSSLPLTKDQIVPTTTVPFPTNPQMPVELSFIAEYMEVPAILDIGKEPIVTVITSAADLALHCASYPDATETAPFQQSIQKYNESFFAENTLILLLKNEGSVSIDHQVKSVTYLAEDCIIVAVDCIYPEAGAEREANWYIFIEVNEKIDADVIATAVCTIVHKEESDRPIRNEYKNLSDEELIWEIANHPYMERISVNDDLPIDMEELEQLCPPYAELRSRDSFMESMYAYAVPIVKDMDYSSTYDFGFERLVHQLCPDAFQ